MYANASSPQTTTAASATRPLETAASTAISAHRSPIGKTTIRFSQYASRPVSRLHPVRRGAQPGPDARRRPAAGAGGGLVVQGAVPGVGHVPDGLQQDRGDRQRPRVRQPDPFRPGGQPGVDRVLLGPVGHRVEPAAERAEPPGVAGQLAVHAVQHEAEVEQDRRRRSSRAGTPARRRARRRPRTAPTARSRRSGSGRGGRTTLVTSGDQVLTAYVVKKSSFSLTASRSRARSSSTAATAARAAASSAVGVHPLGVQQPHRGGDRHQAVVEQRGQQVVERSSCSADLGQQRQVGRRERRSPRRTGPCPCAGGRHAGGPDPRAGHPPDRRRPARCCGRPARWPASTADSGGRPDCRRRAAAARRRPGRGGRVAQSVAIVARRIGRATSGAPAAMQRGGQIVGEPGGVGGIEGVAGTGAEDGQRHRSCLLVTHDTRRNLSWEPNAG